MVALTDMSIYIIEKSRFQCLSNVQITHTVTNIFTTVQIFYLGSLQNISAPVGLFEKLRPLYYVLLPDTASNEPSLNVFTQKLFI